MGQIDRTNRACIITVVVSSALFACNGGQQFAAPLLIADPPPTIDGRLPGAGMSDMDRGVAYLNSDAYAEAIPHFDLALAAQPNNAEAEYYRALSYDKTGNRVMAEEGYTRALVLKPELVGARIKLGAIYLEEPVQPGRAVAVLEPAVQVDPRAVDLRENLAYAYRLLKSYDRSAAHYSAAVGIAPSGRLHFAYADVLFEMEHLDGAAEQYKVALPHFKDDIKALEVIADRLRKAKRFDDCIEAFTMAIGINGSEPHYYLHRGLCKHSLDNELGARADYHAALDVDSTNQAAWYYIGRSWLSDENRVKAGHALERCRELGKKTRYGAKAKKVLDEMRKERLRR